MKVHQCRACRDACPTISWKGRAPAAFPPVGAYFLVQNIKPPTSIEWQKRRRVFHGLLNVAVPPMRGGFHET